MARRTVYFQLDEQVTSALNKIKRAGSDDVLVVVPKGSRILYSLTTLKLLKTHTDKLGKVVHFATADPKGAVLVRRAGFPLEGKMPSGMSKTAQPNQPRRMGDIVGRPQKISGKTVPPKTKQAAKKQLAEKELSHLIGPQSEKSNFTVPDKPKAGPFWKRYQKYIILATGIVVGVLAVMFFVLPRADITVTARNEAISRDLEMLIDSQATEVNTVDLIIPGEVITQELTESQTFTATGQKPTGKQATGTVRFRNFSNNTLVLRKETTRLEIDGRVYRMQEDIGGLRTTRRQGSAEDAPIDESTLTDPVSIIAEQPGVEYNVAQDSKFEVINEVFGHQPEVLFAVNDTGPVSGGTDESVTIVSEEDVAAARENLRIALIERLAKTLEGDARIVENGTVVEVTEEALSHPVGTEIDAFQLTHAATVGALSFSESQVTTVITDRIVRLLPENKHLVESEAEPLQASFVSLDLSAGAGTLRANYRSLIQYTVSREFLQNGLRGKTETQVKEILLSRPEVQNVEVNLWPFWVNKVPTVGGKVEFKVVE